MSFHRLGTTLAIRLAVYLSIGLTAAAASPGAAREQRGHHGPPAPVAEPWGLGDAAPVDHETLARRVGAGVPIATLETLQAPPPPPPPSASGLTRSGRWFIYEGRPVYLAGIDAQELAADPSTDYLAVLDQLRASRINKLRIWIDVWFGGTRYLRPWASDTQGRFDLETWNDAYWRRLQAFANAAQARDIIVEVSIFDVYPSEARWWLHRSSRQAWNKDFNSNNAFSTNAAGHFFPDFYTLTGTERSSTGKTLYDYQRALVDKVIASLDRFHNIYYEIDNEFPGGNLKQDDVYPWQQYWAHYVRQRSGKVVDVHAGSDLTGDGAQYYWDEPYVDGIDFHLYDQDPDAISRLLHNAQIKGKILQCNESYEWYSGTSVDMRLLDGATREAWGWFVAGGYYAVYNGHRTWYSGWDIMANRIKVLRDLVDTMEWWLMSPVDASGNDYHPLASQGPTSRWQILAQPGSQYVVYYWDDGSETPGTTPASLQLPAGTYEYSWYDPTNGERLASGAVLSAGRPTAVAAPPATWKSTVGVLLIVQQRRAATPLGSFALPKRVSPSEPQAAAALAVPHDPPPFVRGR